MQPERLGLPALPAPGPGPGAGQSSGAASSPATSGAGPAAATAPQSLLFGLTRTARIAILTFAAGGFTGATVHSFFDHYGPEATPERFTTVAGPPAALPAPAPVAAAAPVAAPIPNAAPPEPTAAPRQEASPPVAIVEDAPAVAHAHHHTGERPERSDHTVDHAADADGVRHDTDFAAERALLETARTALSRGQSDAALEVLSRHARRFSHGRLVEERESLWVQALVQAGRDPEARERGERFRRQFPSSLFQPIIDAALKKPN